MTSQPWKTNASTRVDEFVRQKAVVKADVEAIARVVRRLEIDPFDIPATRDHVGEWHYRIGPSATEPESTLAMTFLIDIGFRYVEIISFEIYRFRAEP